MVVSCDYNITLRLEGKFYKIAIKQLYHRAWNAKAIKRWHSQNMSLAKMHASLDIW